MKPRALRPLCPLGSTRSASLAVKVVTSCRLAILKCHVHLKTAEAPGKAGDQLGISWEYHRNTNNNYIDNRYFKYGLQISKIRLIFKSPVG